MSETYFCPYHKVDIEMGVYCPQCMTNYKSRTDAKGMSSEDKAVELESMGILTIPFSLVHKRIEELAGRPVWTHEMCDMLKSLIEEVRSGKMATADDIIEKIAHKKVIPIICDVVDKKEKP